MPKGLLTVVGSLDISQFWPATKGNNASDGDTVHLKVDPTTSFLFSGSPGVKPKITKAYIGTHVVDHGLHLPLTMPLRRPGKRHLR